MKNMFIFQHSAIFHEICVIGFLTCFLTFTRKIDKLFTKINIIKFTQFVYFYLFLYEKLG